MEGGRKNSPERERKERKKPENGTWGEEGRGGGQDKKPEHNLRPLEI